MKMKNFLAKISYDGTEFRGWQIQKEGRTVQQVIEDALSVIAKTDIKITSAGRTDAGVHALGQYANFHFPIPMSTDQIRLALRSNLPSDVSIMHIRQVSDDFSARYDAKSRIYQYVLTKERSPFNRNYKSFIPRVKINTEIIEKCLEHFIGKHDFTSFAKYNPDLNNYFCNISKFVLEETNEDYKFLIRSNRFLHNMVRRIIGTIINISNTQSEPVIIQQLISAKTPDNKLISTAPPNGLYLLDVEYPTL